MFGKPLIYCLLCLCFLPALAFGQLDTEIDSGDGINAPKEKQDLEELLLNAQTLLATGRPIDARAKLIEAVRLAPNDYRPHMLLGRYYLFEVAHFKLAYRHLKTSDTKFAAKYGKDDKVDALYQNQHAILLYLLSEAELNLDKYEESLKTLDRFEERYWMDWYPGTRAWLLMKLKRVDEAIRIAQFGVYKKSDLRRTWNILGILLSVKGKRELSLEAFKEAIKAELSIGGSGMIATPLNNAGEVYREMFKDDLAEASWVRAVRLPDGCEHILPSLNLANLYIDQLRLFQAERVLRDFEACFQQQSFRKDTEHRTLLALARGKIALHSNKLAESLEKLEVATSDQQWFGKIGTNENDVKVAASSALAQTLNAIAVAKKDTYYDSYYAWAKSKVEIPFLRARAWWLNRQARKTAVEELEDFEDLFIRNTDSMIQYPTLGRTLAGFNTASASKRFTRMKETDSRENAHLYYDLYRATNLLEAGERSQATKILREISPLWRSTDRLARAETLALLTLAQKRARSFWQTPSSEELQNIEELYSLLPSQVRYYDFRLPVKLNVNSTNSGANKYLKTAAKFLQSNRFLSVPDSNARYQLSLLSPESGTLKIQLVDSKNSAVLASSSVKYDISKNEEPDLAKLINKFNTKAFKYRVDAQANPLPQLPLLNGIL
jgi:hypothetical protein